VTSYDEQVNLVARLPKHAEIVTAETSESESDVGIDADAAPSDSDLSGSPVVSDSDEVEEQADVDVRTSIDCPVLTAKGDNRLVQFCNCATASC